MRKFFIVMVAFAMIMAPVIAGATVITPKGQVVEADVILIQQFSYNANGDLEFIGKADSGTGTNEAAWFIQKCIYNASGDLTGMLNAGGQPDFDKVWENRESYTYK